MNICQMNYLLQKVPATATRRASIVFDDFLFNTWNELTGGTLPRDTFREIQLPLRPIAPGQPSLGLGFTSPHTIAPGAYLSSVARTYPLAQRIAGETLNGMDIFELHYATQSHVLLTKATPSGTTREQAVFRRGTEALLQRDLSELLQRRTWDNLQAVTLRRQAFRAALSLPGAKDWAKAIPSTHYHTHADNTSFRTWLKFYCGIPLANRNETQCPRRGCHIQVNQFGDHLLT